MPGVRLVRADDRRRVPWRNGAGVTEEIDAEIRDGAVIWRLSVADLDAAGQFSSFTGIDRVFTVIGAHGVRLDWPDAAVALTPWLPHPFDGAAPPHCTPAGSTRAFNVMAARAAATTTVTDIRSTTGACVTDPDETTALFVRSGTAHAGGHDATPGDCIVVRHTEVPLRGDGLLVRIRPTHQRTLQ